MIESQLLQSGIKYIAGVDEAGRGPCAGPLVVAAAILKDPLSSALKDVKDSKQLTSLQRDHLFELVKSNSLSYSIIEISAEEIDMLGLHKCNCCGSATSHGNSICLIFWSIF